MCSISVNTNISGNGNTWDDILTSYLLTHFIPTFNFYTHWKRQKEPLVFWRFQGV